MEPLLKWAGGKRHIADTLKNFFPVDWNENTYYEPFIGGGAMLFNLKPNKAVIADFNSRLVTFYCHTRDNHLELFEEIVKVAADFNIKDGLEEKKHYFLQLRREFNTVDKTSLRSSVLLYTLNKLCFNGLYRENSKGEFNVPFGQKKVFPGLKLQDFEEARRILVNTDIVNQDFEKTMIMAVEGDFIYLDPPYIPVNLTSSFTAYHAEGFSSADQKRLADRMVALQKKGIKAMCSNSDTPLARDIYAELRFEVIEAPRMVSASAGGRGKIKELVIMNY